MCPCHQGARVSGLLRLASEVLRSQSDVVVGRLWEVILGSGWVESAQRGCAESAQILRSQIAVVVRRLWEVILGKSWAESSDILRLQNLMWCTISSVERMGHRGRKRSRSTTLLPLLQESQLGARKNGLRIVVHDNDDESFENYKLKIFLNLGYYSLVVLYNILLIPCETSSG